VPTLPFRPKKSPRQIFPKYRVVGQGDTLYLPVKISSAGELPFSSNRRPPAYPDGSIRRSTIPIQRSLMTLLHTQRDRSRSVDAYVALSDGKT